MKPNDGPRNMKSGLRLHIAIASSRVCKPPVTRGVRERLAEAARRSGSQNRLSKAARGIGFQKRLAEAAFKSGSQKRLVQAARTSRVHTLTRKWIKS
jgi:hypothetical protein